MRTLLCFLLSLSGCVVMAQSTLKGGSAALDVDGKKVHVKQSLEVQLPDSVQQLRLRVLDFDGSSLSNISISANNLEIPFEVSGMEGIRSFDLRSDQGFQQLAITYEVGITQSDFYVPFFFTDLASADSENGFFKIAISLPEAQAYTLHFPNGNTKETISDGKKMIVLEVPALISVLRMEVLDGEKIFGFASIMDGLVVLVFVVMGVLIWLNRKRLVYG